MTHHNQDISPASLSKALIFAIFPSFFGILGLHRLYTKRFYAGIFMVCTSSAFMINTVTFLITLFSKQSSLEALGNFSGLLFMFLMPLEIITALIYFYDVILLLSLRFKDAQDALVLPPKHNFLSTRSFAVTLFLTLNGGWFGLHRIYLGRKRSGSLMVASGIANLCLLIAGVFMLISGMELLGLVFLFIPGLHLIWWIEDLLHVMQFKLLDDRDLPVCRN